MSDTPLISVIIPCYNAADFIEKTLDAVFAQAYHPIEIVCVDDGSKDSTLQQIKNYPREVNVITGKNAGASHARNKGFEISKGEYIQFLDADDLLLPNKLDHQVSMIRNEPEKKVDIILGSYLYKTTDGKTEKKQVYANDHWKGLIMGKIGITSANLYHKNIIKAVKGWNETLESSQDTDLTFRIFKEKPKILIDDACNTLVVQHAGSISNKPANKMANLERSMQLRTRILEFLTSEGNLDTETQNLIHQKLFSNIKEMAMYDMSTALERHHQYLPASYQPDDKNIHALYRRLYRWVGFKNVESLMRHYHKIKQLMRGI